MQLFILLIALTVVQSDDSSNVDIIQISARNARDFSTSPIHFYYKHQIPSHFNVSVSDIYIKIPGLRTTFNVAQPTLFEMPYQGSCEVHRGKGVHIKLLVDDHLIIGDSRTPNVPQRHLLTNPISGATSTQFRSMAVVYAGPGVHVFDIDVHHGDIGLSSVIFGEIMRFKWTVVDHPGLVQGLTLWNTTTKL